MAEQPIYFSPRTGQGDKVHFALKTIIQIGVTIIYRLRGFISPGGLPCLPPAHYLANLAFHLSLIFYLFPPTQPLRCISRPAQRKRMLIPDAHHHPMIEHPRGYEPLDTSPMSATDALGEKFPGHPPSSQIVFLAHKSIPRKIQERFGKGTSSFIECGLDFKYKGGVRIVGATY